MMVALEGAWAVRAHFPPDMKPWTQWTACTCTCTFIVGTQPSPTMVRHELNRHIGMELTATVAFCCRDRDLISRSHWSTRLDVHPQFISYKNMCKNCLHFTIYRRIGNRYALGRGKKVLKMFLLFDIADTDLPFLSRPFHIPMRRPLRFLVTVKMRYTLTLSE